MKKKKKVGQSGFTEGRLKTERRECSGAERVKCGYELIGEHSRGGVRDAKRENCV